MRPVRAFTPAVLAMFWGVGVWAAHFTIVYGYTGLACARRVDASGAAWVASVPWVVFGATLAAAALIVALLVRGRGDGGFERRMGRGVGALALVAIALEGGAALWVPACG